MRSYSSKWKAGRWIEHSPGHSKRCIKVAVLEMYEENGTRERPYYRTYLNVRGVIVDLGLVSCKTRASSRQQATVSAIRFMEQVCEMMVGSKDRALS